MRTFTKLSEAFDTDRFGSKASKLATAIKAGHAVSMGVVLSCDDVAKIRDTGKVDQEFITALMSIFPTPELVAVRSSGVNEDGVNQSWAGQFLTVLSIDPRAHLSEAILRCACSSDTHAVRAYGEKNGSQSGGLALIIQKMVPARIAGVLFTRNPVGLYSTEMVIEAIEGVGEALVSGHKEPRRFFIEEATGKILRAEGSSTPHLDTATIKNLAEKGKQLRTDFGEEIDVEWALDNEGELFVLQVRPITTLKSDELTIDELRARIIGEISSEVSDELKGLRKQGLGVDYDVLSDQNIAELVTPHPHRLAMSMFTTCFAHGAGAIRTARNEMGYAIGDEMSQGFFVLVGGQPRCSIVHDALTYRIQGITLAEYAKLIRHYLDRISEDPRLANYPEVVLYDQNPTREFLGKVFGHRRGPEIHEVYARFCARISTLEATYAHACRTEWLPAWENEVQVLRDRSEAVHTVSEKLSILQETVDALRLRPCQAFVKVSRLAFFAYARLRKMLYKLSDDPENDLHSLTAGNDQSMRLGLACVQFRTGDRTLASLLDEFGHLSPHELEIGFPRYREMPEAFEALAQHAPLDVEEVVARNRARSDEIRERLVQRAGSMAGEFLETVETSRTYLVLRESVKFSFLKGYDVVRSILLGIGRMLALDSELLFHLTIEELPLLRDDLSRAKHEASRCKAERSTLMKVYIPKVIDTRHLEEIGIFKGETDGSLHGVGVTNAITEGVALVLPEFPKADEVPLITGNTVLVTVTTDPAWTPVLTKLAPTGGLVTEIGGLLAHGAIISRELGIAAVLNIPEATHLIKTGMRVRVNGHNGTVEILP